MLSSPRYSLYWPFFFLMKRFLFAAVAVSITTFSWAAISCLLVGQMLMMCYLVSAWPFEDPYLNWLELGNEGLILVLIYLMYMFAGLIPDPEINYEIAGYLTILLYACLSVNLLVTVGVTLA